MFFNGWESIGRTVVAAILAYLSLILILRLSGKRTLAKMNAFDLVVTVALGSTLATIVSSRDVALAEGITALALLVALQFVVTWLSVRSGMVRRLVRAEPTMLLYRGSFLHDAMRAQRVTESEVRQAARSGGVADLATRVVVLETDGTFSILSAWDDAAHPSIAGILRKQAENQR